MEGTQKMQNRIRNNKFFILIKILHILSFVALVIAILLVGGFVIDTFFHNLIGIYLSIVIFFSSFFVGFYYYENFKPISGKSLLFQIGITLILLLVIIFILYMMMLMGSGKLYM
jgi:hypothetical protein